MAQSMCPRCEHQQFEIVQYTPINTKSALFFVQCAMCGSVISVLEHDHFQDRIQQFEANFNKRLEDIQHSMHQLEYELRHIKHRI